MAGRLTAEIVALLEHLLEHVAVTDRRAHHADALPFEEAFQPEIGHHGGDDAGLGETAVVLPALRDHREQETELGLEAKTLFMSGYPDGAIASHGMLEPGVAYLAKPFTTEAVTRRVREVLEAR